MKIFKLIIMTNVSEVKRSKLNQGNCKTPPISQQTQTVQTKISETRLLEASTNRLIMTYIVFMLLMCYYYSGAYAYFFIGTQILSITTGMVSGYMSMCNVRAL